MQQLGSEIREILFNRDNVIRAMAQEFFWCFIMNARLTRPPSRVLQTDHHSVVQWFDSEFGKCYLVMMVIHVLKKLSGTP